MKQSLNQTCSVEWFFITLYFLGKAVDYESLLKGNLHLISKAEQLAEWKKDYESMSKEMFYNPPKFDEIMIVIQKFEEEFNRI